MPKPKPESTYPTTHAEEPAAEKPRTAAERIREAEEVRDALGAALFQAGVVLPSLRLDPCAYAEQKPRPMVDLGRCNLQTARDLTAALQGRRKPG
jgi:hypothetical protein